MRLKDPSKWMKKVCERCGKSFDVPTWRLRLPPAHWYCGYACYHVGRMVSVKDRFLKFVKPPNANGCMLWSGGISHSGYGVFSFGKKSFGSGSAHRIAYTLANGPIPPGMMVCHTCDVRACCNPAHMFLGTASDNMKDKCNKGKGRGGNNPLAKLTDDQVRAIRKAVAEGESQISLAIRYGVSRSSLSQIATGRTWRHVV